MKTSGDPLPSLNSVRTTKKSLGEDMVTQKGTFNIFKDTKINNTTAVKCPSPYSMVISEYLPALSEAAFMDI